MNARYAPRESHWSNPAAAKNRLFNCFPLLCGDILVFICIWLFYTGLPAPFVSYLFPPCRPRIIGGLSRRFIPYPTGLKRGISPLKGNSLAIYREKHKQRVKERRSLSYIPFPLPYQREGDKGGGFLIIKGVRLKY